VFVRPLALVRLVFFLARMSGSLGVSLSGTAFDRTMLLHRPVFPRSLGARTTARRSTA
jgi:hypothetical protein